MYECGKLKKVIGNKFLFPVILEQCGLPAIRAMESMIVHAMLNTTLVLITNAIINPSNKVKWRDLCYSARHIRDSDWHRVVYNLHETKLYVCNIIFGFFV